MSKASMSVALTERQEREIEAFCQIAKENGAVVSLRELIGLAAIDASENDLATLFDSPSRLSSKFLLESGYVLQRTEIAEGGARRAVEDEERRRARAELNLRRASRFGKGLMKGSVIVSVSGGNAYLSATENEDIDFFCVTKKDGLWPFLLKALVLARVHRLANRDVPELCFSCMMDESWAQHEFGKRQDPIFARDALTARVIAGRGAYHSLLEDGAWMENYFPSFYGMRLRETSVDVGPRGKETRATGSPILNSFLFHTLGPFLRLKSWALNRRLTKAAKHSSVFETRVGKGFYIFESNRYRKLRSMYGEMEKDS